MKAEKLHNFYFNPVSIIRFYEYVFNIDIIKNVNILNIIRTLKMIMFSLFEKLLR